VGQYSIVELWNPADSGVELFVKRLNMGSGANAGTIAYSFNTALHGTPTTYKPLSSMTGIVDLTAVSVGYNSATINEIVANRFGFLAYPSGETGYYTPVSSIGLEPGRGLYIWQLVTNAELAVGIEYSRREI
jgi:hypothetical protein